MGSVRGEAGEVEGSSGSLWVVHVMLCSQMPWYGEIEQPTALLAKELATLDLSQHAKTTM